MTEVYTLDKLAERWDFSRSFVYRLIVSGELPSFSIGKLKRVRAEHVYAYEQSGRLALARREAVDVYVIKCGSFIKIGKASNVERRLAQLQSANPMDVEVLAILTDGDGHSLESDLHSSFKDYIHRNEWFRQEGRLADWIDAGCVVPPRFDKPAKLSKT